MINLPPNRPNNDIEFVLPLSQPYLRSGGRCFTHDGWSRDDPHPANADWRHLNETSNSGDVGNSLLAMLPPQLVAFPNNNNNIHDHGSHFPGERRGHLPESETWHHDLELESLATSTIGETGYVYISIVPAS